MASTRTIIKNESGSKAVNIAKNTNGGYLAQYVQVYNGEEQVLQSKSFSSLKKAEKWAKTILE